MPLYEYRCQQCGEVFERIQKFSDEPLSVHEGCGGPVERLVSAAALRFKGTGWYITDYAKNGKSSGSNGKTEKKTEAKTESKSDSKPSAESKPSTSAPPSGGK